MPRGAMDSRLILRTRRANGMSSSIEAGAGKSLLPLYEPSLAIPRAERSKSVMACAAGTAAGVLIYVCWLGPSVLP